MDGSFIVLTDEEQENLLLAIETSLQVKRRHQFFLWTQGPLQAFIRHKILVCLITRDGKEPLAIDRFNSCVVSDQALEEACSPESGLVMQAMDAWRANEFVPLLIEPGVPDPESIEGRCARLIEQAEFGNVVAHGNPSVDGFGISSSFFFFASVPIKLTHRHIYFLELLMPHIHMAFQRTLGHGEPLTNGSDASMRFGTLTKTMSEREIEILRWVQEGKSNQEIGMILNISPLTVKNHVQKVLRKLDVRNRAQAVSKATAMRIINYTGSA